MWNMDWNWRPPGPPFTVARELIGRDSTFNSTAAVSAASPSQTAKLRDTFDTRDKSVVRFTGEMVRLHEILCTNMHL